MDGVGGPLHLFKVVNGAAFGVADAVELVGLGEIAEDARDVCGYIGIVEAEFAFITIAHDLLEEGFERMRLGLHSHLPIGAGLQSTPKTKAAVREQPGSAHEVAAVPFCAAREDASDGSINKFLTLRLAEQLRLARGGIKFVGR